MSVASTYWDLRATKLVPVVGPAPEGRGLGITNLVQVPEFTDNQVRYFYNMEPRLIMFLGNLAEGRSLQEIRDKGTYWLKALYNNYIDFRGLPEDIEYPPLEQLWYTYSAATNEYRMTVTHFDRPQTPYQYFFALTKWMKAATDMIDVSSLVALTSRIARHNASIRDSFLTRAIRGTFHPDAIQKNLLRRELGPKWPGKPYGRPF